MFHALPRDNAIADLLKQKCLIDVTNRRFRRFESYCTASNFFTG